jgi:hypothetical protein
MGDFVERNSPGSRGNATTWTDHEGNLWLFGGNGSDSYNASGHLNDLWEFNISKGQWAWMGGSDSVADGSHHADGVYGKLGKPAKQNRPGGRESASGWVDNAGNFWLFGGSGAASAGTAGLLNDLWRFDPHTLEWTWMGGSNTIETRTISGNLCVGRKGDYSVEGLPASVPNTPGARTGASTWTDREGNFWLFGGDGLDADCKFGFLNDLWEYRFLPEAEAPAFNIKAGVYMLSRPTRGAWIETTSGTTH